tara:strand:+ start:2106 stop:2408 length:303 start_codon:yes stop_codon:yes gene_type:complete
MAWPLIVRTLIGVNRNPRELTGIFRPVPGMRIIGPMVLTQSHMKVLNYVLHVSILAVIWAATSSVFGVAVGAFLARVSDHFLRLAHALIAALAICRSREA